jgi:hypothetical protein
MHSLSTILRPRRQSWDKKEKASIKLAMQAITLPLCKQCGAVHPSEVGWLSAGAVVDMHLHNLATSGTCAEFEFACSVRFNDNVQVIISDLWPESIQL